MTITICSLLVELSCPEICFINIRVLVKQYIISCDRTTRLTSKTRRSTISSKSCYPILCFSNTCTWISLCIQSHKTSNYRCSSRGSTKCTVKEPTVIIPWEVSISTDIMHTSRKCLICRSIDVNTRTTVRICCLSFLTIRLNEVIKSTHINNRVVLSGFIESNTRWVHPVSRSTWSSYTTKFSTRILSIKIIIRNTI